MKAFFLLCLTLTAVHARASGCLGGNWRVVSVKDLNPTEIEAGYYGEPIAEVEVYKSINGAYVTWKNVGSTSEKLTFYSGMIDLNQVNLVDLLQKLNDLSPSFFATKRETVEVNEYYDDCSDIPEGTALTRIEYGFSLELGNGISQPFHAQTVTYNPPLN